MMLRNKLLIGLMLPIFSVLSFSANSAPLKDDQAFAIYIPKLRAGFELTASALYLQPQANNLGWAVITTVLPIPSPNWFVQSINPKYQPGFNLGAAYVSQAPGTDYQLKWSHLNTTETDNVAVNPNSQWVSPFSQTGTPPTGGQITGVALLKLAHARLNFNYDSVNLDVGKFVNFGDNFQARFFTGLSSVYIKEKLVSTFRGFSLPILSLDNTSTYAGLGPRLGVNNKYDLPHHIQLVGQFSGTLLFGRMQPAQYRFTGTSEDLILAGIYLNQEGLATPSINQLVPALDAKLGLSVTHVTHKSTLLTFEAGYMGAIYFDPLSGYETNNNVIALDTGSLSTASAKHTQSNFSVGGPYISVNYKC